MRYAIYACEGIYGGLHGIYNVAVFEDTYAGAREWGYNASHDLIEDYDSDEIESIREVYGDEAVEDFYCDNIDYQIWEIDEDIAKDISTDRLDELISEMGYEDFVETYCIKED